MREAAWSGQTLIEAINLVGREAGLPLRYNRSSVTQWLTGITPRPPVPHVVAEALSRRLGRRITVGETGFDGPETEIDDRGTGPITRLATMAVEADPQRIATSLNRIYRLAVLSSPGEDTADDTRTPRGLRYSPLRVGQDDVETAGTMLRLFTAADNAIGAGYVRPVLILYLADAIAPLLQASPREVRDSLLQVATGLTYLCGLTCYDDELHGFAQRYFDITLRFCAEVEQVGLRSQTLCAMSVQALSLGYPGHALDLAQRAVSVASRADPPPGLAALLGQLAVARAATGDRRGALSDIDAARSRLRRGGDGEEAPADRHEAALAHQHGLMLAILNDRPRAIAELEFSARHRPDLERRSRALTLFRLADVQLRHGLLQESIQSWHRFLDDYPALKCGRARTALTLLPTFIQPYRNTPAAKALLARAAAMRRLPQVARDQRVLPIIPPQDLEVGHPLPAQWDRPFPRFCIGCGVRLGPSGTRRNRLYCGIDCRRRNYREHKKRTGG
ncbi:hypothetical protein DP939_23400 [Spongiactinospora rosea]|uniref:Tetratricopeptide repeat protein n=2 Tax=Spongiactinospora rosea TaxID=2248750 RepID=A0A366LV24_9ACTN|nr:hypothetical protein DP939_23400 [Spongiactinospora rosea]